MLVNVYNANYDYVNTIVDVEQIIECKDGRYLVTSNKKCKYYHQDNKSTTQIPANYTIKIET